jgi:spermidine/putrescine transport system substrate-binding protein
MKLRLLGAAAVALLLAAGTARADGELHIFNWGDYTSPKLIEKFEKQYNVKVTLDSYDSNETMLAKVRAGGSGYDIVVPSDYTVKIMIEGDMLAKTEPNKMENFKNVDPKWIDVYWDPGRNYSVPWQYGLTTFTVNTAKYKGDINTLALMFDPPPELQGRINVLDDMNSLFNAGLRYLGLPRCNGNPEDLKKLYDLLMTAKKSWRTFDYDTIGKLTSGDVDLSQNWNGYSWRARQQVSTLTFAYPKEGIEGFMDNVAVLKDAPNMENAKLFQNFIMDPENAAMISEFARYNNGIVGSDKFLKQIDPDFAAAPEINAPASAPAPEFVPPCPKEVTDKYNKIWTALKK